MRKQTAFTLIEILVAMALTVLVGGIVYLFHASGSMQVNKGASSLFISSDLRNKMEIITEDIRNSKAILSLTPEQLKLSTYKNRPPFELGDSSLVTVTYDIEKDSDRKRAILWRTEDKGKPEPLITCDDIEENAFRAYWKGSTEETDSGWYLYPFRSEQNDSWQREFISLVKIKLKVTVKGETAELETSVIPRPAESRTRQPNWKFRS